MTTEPLRKAAILVSSLDRASADALLDQMPAEQASRVRQAVLELDTIDAGEQRQVIAEFLRSRGGTAEAAGVELEPSLVRQFSTMATAPQTAAAVHSKAAAPAAPFRFLHEATSETLGKLLQQEHPQMAALVIAHLPPARAAQIVAKFPPALQADVLRRVVDLDEASPEVLKELEDSLEHLLADELRATRRRTAGLATVGAILSAAEGQLRDGMLTNLARADAQLAARLGSQPTPRNADNNAENAPPKQSRLSFFWSRPAPAPAAAQASAVEEEFEEPLEEDDLDYDPDEIDTELEEQPAASAAPLPRVEFSDFTQFDNRSLALVLTAADPRIAILALTGARRELVDRLLKQLPARDAKALRKQMEQSGPLRLRDVEIAQQQLALVAGRLAGRGDIKLPVIRRFAAAA